MTQLTSVESTSGVWAKDLARSLARWLERGSDILNPILVKECRQAMKSRQFLVSFVLLLIGVAGWSWIGVLVQMPSIKYAGGGSTLMVGYLLMLTFPMLIMVPHAAFRSLAAEREDGTLELVSITLLSARQLVGGKLASAVLQMMVYNSVLAPCLAFTYLLRGTDLVGIVFLLGHTFLISLILSAFGLLLASCTRSRSAHLVLSGMFPIGLLLAWFFWISFAGSGIFSSQFSFHATGFWVGNLMVLSLAVSTLVLFGMAAAGQLSFASDNHSTPLRLVMLVQQQIWIGWMAYGVSETDASNSDEIVLVMASLAAFYWYVMGALLSGESGQLSRRARRRLPQSFLGRMAYSWLHPGAGPGYVFAVANLYCVVGVAIGLFVLRDPLQLLRQLGTATWSAIFHIYLGMGEIAYLLLLPAYVAIYLGASRLIHAGLRRVRMTGMLGSVVINAILAMIGILLPLSIDVVLFKSDAWMAFGIHHSSNWQWVLELAVDGDLEKAYPEVFWLIQSVAVALFFCNLLLASREANRLRLAVPARVQTADEELPGQPGV